MLLRDGNVMAHPDPTDNDERTVCDLSLLIRLQSRVNGMVGDIQEQQLP